MEKINLDELRKTDEYKNYLKTLVGSNNQCVGYDRSHTHVGVNGTTSPALGNNFFIHQHYDGERLLGYPYEYDPETLDHHHEIKIDLIS